MIFCMANMQSEEERKGKERKKRRKEKQFWVKPRRAPIHAPPKEEENAETNQMMWYNHGYNH